MRHCTFRVPRYLLTGGKGQSWEWLTEVTPKVSWKYNAVGRPLFSEAEGRTRLEDLGNGTTRLHFSETYHAFNPFLRALLEKRVHAFISKDNDRLIKESLTKGVGYLRAAKAKAQAKAAGQGPAAGRRRAPTRRDGRRPLGQCADREGGRRPSWARPGTKASPSCSGGDLSASSTLQHLLVTMDKSGVDVGVIAAGIAAEETGPLLDEVAAHPDRLRVALTSDRPDRPVQQVTRLRALAEHPAVALVRITPLVHQYPLNDKLYYPVYTACAELGLPVSINVGIPGPRVRSACQHPTLLEDVLIDFKGLTVIGAHMGHPYEALLMQYMLKWPDLYLSNSAYLATYMDPALVSFMDSSRGMGRVLFASDHPFLPMERAVAAARDLPLSDAAAEAFLGGTATRLLDLA